MKLKNLVEIAIPLFIFGFAMSPSPLYSSDQNDESSEAVVIEPLSSLLSTDFEESKGTSIAPQVNLPITLELFPEATVTDSRIFLGKVSSCQGYSEICNDSLGIDLGPAPLPGKTSIVSQTDIERLLKEEFPSSEVTLSGSPQVKISSIAKDISPEAIQTKLEKVIADKFSTLEDVRIKVDHIQIIQAPKLGAFSYQIEFPHLFSKNFGSTDKLIESLIGNRSHQFIILLEDNNERPYTGQILATISAERLVSIAKTNLQKGQILRLENVAWSWIPINGNLIKYVQDFTSFSQNNPPVLRSEIKTGNPIPLDRLEFPPLIQKGQLVNIILKNNGLEITGKAKALRSGNENEFIEVTYPVTKKTVSAKIIDRSTVEVKF